MSKDELKIPYDIIVKAKYCDETAIAYILNYFSSYIKKLALVPTLNKSGNVVFVVDDDIVSQLQAKLILCIINDFQL